MRKIEKNDMHRHSYRRVLRMHYIEGLTWKEISIRLNVTMSNIGYLESQDLRQLASL